MSNQSSYDARSISSQGTQKVFKQAGGTLYELTKALFSFVGHMVKILLAK